MFRNWLHENDFAPSGIGQLTLGGGLHHSVKRDFRVSGFIKPTLTGAGLHDETSYALTQCCLACTTLGVDVV